MITSKTAIQRLSLKSLILKHLEFSSSGASTRLQKLLRTLKRLQIRMIGVEFRSANQRLKCLCQARYLFLQLCLWKTRLWHFNRELAVAMKIQLIFVNHQLSPRKNHSRSKMCSTTPNFYRIVWNRTLSQRIFYLKLFLQSSLMTTLLLRMSFQKTLAHVTEKVWMIIILVTSLITKRLTSRLIRVPLQRPLPTKNRQKKRLTLRCSLSVYSILIQFQAIILGQDLKL